MQAPDAVAQSPHAHDSTTAESIAPHPGSQSMPRWNVGELPDAPAFQWKNWLQFLGPGLLMGGAAIGGGEWLLGPIVTARYGGALLWLATLSIACQVIYNVEISRYTLYTGEPIFTGKFRTLPGPMFWVFLYLALDFGSVFPYLAASAATPVAAVYLGHIPNATIPFEKGLLRGLGIAIFLLSLLPLIFGGKIYNSLKAVMTFKIFTVMGFLLFLAVFYSHSETWTEIFTGFFKFGMVPLQDASGDRLGNMFYEMWNGQFPAMELSMIAFLSGLVAISGQGGLSNTPISNYTRDQGWGMGSHVGAIPSLVGGHDLQLSHVGTVFEVNENSLPRWKRWYNHVLRDQLVLWMPACFFGLALPSMLSIEFLPRGTKADGWVAAGMTADAVRERVGGTFGVVCWNITLLCGFLVLAPTMASTIDGVVRRWVDVFWTSSRTLRSLEPRMIKYVYFGVLVSYALMGICMLAWLEQPGMLLKIATNFYNVAFGFSCWHVLAINTILLPKELRPGWFVRISLVLSGLFFWAIAIVSAIQILKVDLKWI